MLNCGDGLFWKKDPRPYYVKMYVVLHVDYNNSPYSTVECLAVMCDGSIQLRKENYDVFLEEIKTSEKRPAISNWHFVRR